MRASWQTDPSSRHQYRWWDGSAWTDAVADDGRPASDPLDDPVARMVRPLGAAPVTVEAEPVAAPPAPEPERVVRTFDPSGAVFAPEPLPKESRRGLRRPLPWWVPFAGLSGIGVVMAAFYFGRSQHWW